MSNILVKAEVELSFKSTIFALLSGEEKVQKILLDMTGELIVETARLGKDKFNSLSIPCSHLYVQDVIDEIELMLDKFKGDCFIIINGVELLTEGALKTLFEMSKKYPFNVTFIATQSITVANNENAVTQSIIRSLQIERNIMLEYFKGKPRLSEGTNIVGLRCPLMITSWWK